ncbi:AAA family ATPase [Sulfurimonas sp.]
MFNLRVKNFGVLKNIDIELGQTNLFIGDNGSGKSTLAKLITVITDITIDEDEIIKRLKDFNIDFLNEECFIQLQEDDELIIEIVGLKIKFSKPRKELVQELEKHEALINLNSLISKAEKESNLDELLNKITKDNKNSLEVLTKFSKNKEHRDNLIDTDKKINIFKSKYIPAERNLISFFNQSLSNIVSAKIPFPKTLLEFSAHYNSARNEIKELDILDMKYKNENSQDRIYYGDYKSNNFLALENSSSGIQSALPLYLTLKYFATKHRNIIIEEPELNLYPKSQIDTVKYMIENRGESSLSIMTHSPYILSILNVLLFAYKASNTNDILNEEISKIIPKEQQIDPDSFSAYLIEDGISKSIKGKSTGMIQENVIDGIGDIIDDEFSELMDIYREFKNDK